MTPLPVSRLVKRIAAIAVQNGNGIVHWLTLSVNWNAFATSPRFVRAGTLPRTILTAVSLPHDLRDAAGVVVTLVLPRALKARLEISSGGQLFTNLIADVITRGVITGFKKSYQTTLILVVKVAYCGDHVRPQLT